MKFGHAFQEALRAESYPRHWVEKAVPYRQLKKILGKVREELIRNGCDPNTLHRLLADHNAEYRLESDDSRLLRPKLMVRPGLGVLSLEQAAEQRASGELTSSIPEGANPGVPDELEDGWVEIPLNSDIKFFGILQADVSELDTLQGEEIRSMQGQIHALGTAISGVARPRRSFVTFSKSDLYRWREIFELYLAAEVFFSTTEASGGLRDSEKARKQLVWFQDEVAKRQLLQKFKVRSSAAAYARFLELNATLLQNLQFQELNQTAITKIIKKFDKQTSLGVKTTFPKVMYSAHFISESISKDICAQLAREVVSLVPQVVDFSCSICLSLCWLPVRLDCDHLFCIRCMIKMQHANKRFCPLCRADVVQRANSNHIDNNLVRFLEKWFPKEMQEKQAYNETERRKELLGEAYVDNHAEEPCVVM